MNSLKIMPQPTLRLLSLTSGLSSTPNSGYTATLRSAQIGSLRSPTSYVRRTLSEMPDAPRLEIEGEDNGIGISK